MSRVVKFRLSNIEECACAALHRSHGDTLEAVGTGSEVLEFKKVWEEFNAECPFPRFWTILSGPAGREKTNLLQGVQYIITDPTTEDGYSFWKEMFKAPEEGIGVDGQVTHKWSALDQVLSIGDVACMVKYNLCKDYVDSNGQEVATNSGSSIVDVAGPCFEEEFMRRVAQDKNTTIMFRTQIVDRSKARITEYDQAVHASGVHPKYSSVFYFKNENDDIPKIVGSTDAP